jgi:hypothetical protein
MQSQYMYGPLHQLNIHMSNMQIRSKYFVRYQFTLPSGVRKFAGQNSDECGTYFFSYALQNAVFQISVHY